MVSLNSCALGNVEVQIYRNAGCSVRLGNRVIINNTEDQVQNGTLLKSQGWGMSQKGRVSFRTVQEGSLDLQCC